MIERPPLNHIFVTPEVLTFSVTFYLKPKTFLRNLDAKISARRFGPSHPKLNENNKL